MRRNNQIKRASTWLRKQLLKKTHISRFSIPNGMFISLALLIIAGGIFYVSYRPTSSVRHPNQPSSSAQGQQSVNPIISTCGSSQSPAASIQGGGNVDAQSSPSSTCNSTQPSNTNTTSKSSTPSASSATKGESCSQTEAIFGPILSTDVANDWSTSNIAGESQSEIDYNYNRFLVTAYQSYESSMTEFGCSPVNPAPSPKSPAYTADCESINGNAQVTLVGQETSLFDGAENYNQELLDDVSHGSMNDSEAISLMNNYISSLNPEYSSDYGSYASTVQAYSSNGCFTTITYPDVMAQCSSYPCTLTMLAGNSSEDSASD